MSYLDTYYRALIDYRKNTTQDKDCGSQRTATVKANAKNDSVILTRKICHVNTDWIERIEQGLEYVDKAIREERQFIRSNGEVVDIEKVRSVSKDSVKHLAQHSNLITRYTEGEDIIPDRLYIVERLNDYAVYENRFLYMMLCYLRDFITVRYNKILELEHTYNGSMSMSKKIEMPKRQMALDISLKETRNDDPFLKERSESKDVISRIRDILEFVHAFLNTPLMEEVSKVPMIKPPITKTNVLRMNNNFRNALALYEYVAAYQGDGYTVEEKVQKIQPFRIDMADEFSEIVLLSSFLTYEHGMGIKAALQQAYEQEEERRRQEQEQKHLEQLRALRRRIEESGESPEEYMLMLERRNRALEADSEQLKVALQKIEDLEARNEYLIKENNELTERLELLRTKMEKIEIAHKAEIENLNAAFEQKIANVRTQCEQKISDLQEAQANEIQELREAQAYEIQELQEKYDQERAELLEAMQTAEMVHQQEMAEALERHMLEMQQHTDNCNNTVAELTARYETETNALRSACEDECARMRNACAQSNITILAKARENEQLAAAKRLLEARLLAMRKEYGLITDAEEFTSRESFEELERQFEVFKGLFNEEWKKTKRQIRKQTFQSYKDAIKEGRDKEFREQLSAIATENEMNAVQPEVVDVTAQDIAVPQNECVACEDVVVSALSVNVAENDSVIEIETVIDEPVAESVTEEVQDDEIVIDESAAEAVTEDAQDDEIVIDEPVAEAATEDAQDDEIVIDEPVAETVTEDAQDDEIVIDESVAEVVAEDVQDEVGTDESTEEEGVEDAADEVAIEETQEAAVEQEDEAMVKIETLMAEFTEKCRVELDEVSAIHINEFEALKAAWKEESDRLYSKCSELDLLIEQKTRENERLEAARRLAEARMLAMRKGCGMLTDADDFTTKETFEELERQYEVFKALFGDEWKKAKRQIRKSVFQMYKEDREKEIRAKLADYGVSDGSVTLDPVLVDEVLAEKEAAMQRNLALAEANAANVEAEAASTQNEIPADTTKDVVEAETATQTVGAEAETEAQVIVADVDTVADADVQEVVAEAQEADEQISTDNEAEEPAAEVEPEVEQPQAEAPKKEGSFFKKLFGRKSEPKAEDPQNGDTDQAEETVTADEVAVDEPTDEQSASMVEAADESDAIPVEGAEESVETEPAAEQGEVALSKKEQKALKKLLKQQQKEAAKAEKAVNDADDTAVSELDAMPVEAMQESFDNEAMLSKKEQKALKKLLKQEQKESAKAEKAIDDADNTAGVLADEFDAEQGEAGLSKKELKKLLKQQQKEIAKAEKMEAKMDDMFGDFDLFETKSKNDKRNKN